MNSNTITVSQAVSLAREMGFIVEDSLTLDHLLAQDDTLVNAAYENAKHFKEKHLKELLQKPC